MEAIKKQEKNYESLDISEKGGRVSPELFIKKNYETYNNERKKQVFASSSKFQIKRVR